VGWVLIATAFAFMVTSQNAAAAARTNLVIGLQNDMVNLNPFDPGTNSVWKAYQTQYNFESLFTYDPNYQIYADLADPAAACPTGTTAAVPGSCVDASNPNITIKIPYAVAFTHGGYAIVFYGTLVSAIIPSGIWKNHLQSTPQINYSDPALGNIKDSVDQSIDFSFGGPGQYDATVGTGPFYMTSWTRNAGSKSLVYGNYWGKSVAHTWAGTSYPFSPPSDGKHVPEFDFIVFGSLDVVSLA